MTKLRGTLRRLGHEGGYSLVELLVTMAILGTVLGAITTVFVSGSKAELDMNRRFQAQQNTRIAFGALRNDVHVSTCADASTTGQLRLYTTATAVRGTCTGSPSTVWCTYLVSSTPIARYDLYRVQATSCPGTEASAKTSGKFETDYLTANALFSDPGSTSGQHQTVTVTMPVSTGTRAGADRYTLTDTIVLRNSPRIP